MSELRLEAEEAVGDDVLLRRFATRREADAFAELARRHAGLVFGTCLRVTGDRHDAEELTQECFFRLASRATSVRTSVAGWLHATATRLALNAVRSRGRRRTHEAKTARDHATDGASQSPWREIEPALDEAVNALPDEIREAIVLRFLQSLSQSEVAARLGVHQSTVSRRVAEGLRRLNERLTAAGVALSAAPLADLLLAHATPDAVPDASRSIGRVALAGATGGVIGVAGSAWVKIRAALLLAVGLLPVVVVEAIAGIWPGIVVAAAYAAFIARWRPTWMDELFPSPDGRSHYDSPFYPLRRWTWTTLPVGWKKAMFRSLASATMLAVQAWAFAQTQAHHRGFPLVGVFATYSAFAFSTFLRIAWKAATLHVQAADPEPSEASRGPDGATVAQSVGSAFAILLMTPCFGLAMRRVFERPEAVTAMLVLLAYCGAWTCLDAVQKVCQHLKAPTTDFVVEPGHQVGTKSRNRVVAVLLVYSTFWTLASMTVLVRWTNPRYTASVQGRRDLEGVGILPPLALLFLATTIRPLALARTTMRPGAWSFAVVLATSLALINTASCLIYLTVNGFRYLVGNP